MNTDSRTDWSLRAEAAWVPEGTSFEIYGEYAPALSTEKAITAYSRKPNGAFSPPQHIQPTKI